MKGMVVIGMGVACLNGNILSASMRAWDIRAAWVHGTGLQLTLLAVKRPKFCVKPAKRGLVVRQK